ncbi:cytochrome P450 [Leifsonia kafniensis]|uniref:Cytochrome P450 n=1 Tax=Leifsonia kafniensis TaxID=475957 RepID=A0ABP7KNC5_9MICO
MPTTVNEFNTVVPEDIARAVIVDGFADTADFLAALEWLRENAPVARVELDGYDPVWLVTTYDEILEVERQPEVFSAGGGDRPGTHNPHLITRAEDDFSLETMGTLRAVDSIEYADGDEHSSMKSMTGSWFRPVSLRALEPEVREVADASISTFLPGTQLDAADVAEFCFSYPLHVIMRVLGESSSYESVYRALVHMPDETATAGGLPGDGEAEAGEDSDYWAEVFGNAFAAFDRIIQERRDAPKNDFATVIASAIDPHTGERFPDSWIHGWYISLITAGHATTSRTLAGILLALATRPEQLALVQRDPTCIPGLVSEGLRWVSPIRHFTRRIEQEYVLRGQLLPAGERVVVYFPSGNRDPAVFTDPDTFDLLRSPNKQIAFGYGMHQCIGQHLARLELRVVLEELLPLIESISLDETGGVEIRLTER